MPRRPFRSSSLITFTPSPLVRPVPVVLNFSREGFNVSGAPLWFAGLVLAGFVVVVAIDALR